MKKLTELISTGRLAGSRGASFRRTSTSKPDDWKDHSGKDVGAMRNFAHEKAAVAKADASRKEREAKVEKRNRDAAQRAKETLRMAKESLDEAKGKFVYDRPLKVHVAAMEKRDTADLRGMHDRWSGDHRDKKSDPATSERLLAVHHVLKKRGESVPDLPQHKNLGMTKRFTEETEATGTAARVKIKNVARLDDEPPTSEKSKLSKQAEIRTKIIEEKPPMRKIDFGLPADLINATRSILEKKTQVELDPETDDKEDNGDNEADDDDDDVKKESKHTTPKSEKDKKLAALAHPKDKITHKDVLVGRGVLKKEETEIEEKTLYGTPDEHKRKLDRLAKKEKALPPGISPARKALAIQKQKLQASMKKEDVDIDSLTEEQLEEVLKKSDPAGKWVSDFVHSKDPKFAGKSKKERMKMALGAYYGKQRNEEVEQIDELEKSKYVDMVYKATDPSYGRGADHIIKRAGREHGAKFAKDLEGIADKGHFPRRGHSSGRDPLKPYPGDTGPRITKAGKMHSADARVMKSKIGSRLGQHIKPNLPESEQLDELSPKTLGGYAVKVASLPPEKVKPSREAGIEKATKKLRGMKEELTAEEIERIEAIAAQLDEAKPTIVSAPIRGANQDQSGFGVKSNTADYTISDSKKVKVKEEVELEEGRGRPKKSGEEAEGDDTAKHPIQQLHKIAVAIQGNEPHFEHKDGSKTKVGKHLAKHITAVYGSMRTTQDKEDFANKLHANRQSMMTAVDKHVR